MTETHPCIHAEASRELDGRRPGRRGRRIGNCSSAAVQTLQTDQKLHVTLQFPIYLLNLLGTMCCQTCCHVSCGAHCWPWRAGWLGHEAVRMTHPQRSGRRSTALLHEIWTCAKSADAFVALKALSSCSVPVSDVAALRHEARDDPVENAALEGEISSWSQLRSVPARSPSWQK